MNCFMLAMFWHIMLPGVAVVSGKMARTSLHVAVAWDKQWGRLDHCSKSCPQKSRTSFQTLYGFGLSFLSSSWAVSSIFQMAVLLLSEMQSVQGTRTWYQPMIPLCLAQRGTLIRGWSLFSNIGFSRHKWSFKWLWWSQPAQNIDIFH